MCQNAQKTIINLMSEIEPSIVDLGNEFNLSNTPAFQTVISEYNVALTAVENWTSGSVAQEVIEAINDVGTAVQALPIPATAKTLVSIILAGLATVIGVLSANSPNPTPAPADSDASPEELQAAYHDQVLKTTTTKVQQLVPGFKRSIWHSAATQYKNTWNAAVKTGKFPDKMLLA
jgi:hypothetical protein